MEVPGLLAPLRRVASSSAAEALEFAFVAGGAPNPLPIDLERQALSNWCWVAVTAAVHTFYGETYATTQCGVASNCLNRQCCPPGSDTDLNPLNVTYNIVASLGSNAVVPPANGTVGFDVVQDEISRGRPICCVVRWDSGGDHALLVAGYTMQEDIWVDDPASPGLHAVPYDAFCQRYGADGHWHASVKTKPSGAK